MYFKKSKMSNLCIIYADYIQSDMQYISCSFLLTLMIMAYS